MDKKALTYGGIAVVVLIVAYYLFKKTKEDDFIQGVKDDFYSDEMDKITGEYGGSAFDNLDTSVMDDEELKELIRQQNEKKLAEAQEWDEQSAIYTSYTNKKPVGMTLEALLIANADFKETAKVIAEYSSLSGESVTMADAGFNTLSKAEANLIALKKQIADQAAKVVQEYEDAIKIAISTTGFSRERILNEHNPKDINGINQLMVTYNAKENRWNQRKGEIQNVVNTYGAQLKTVDPGKAWNLDNIYTLIHFSLEEKKYADDYFKARQFVGRNSNYGKDWIVRGSIASSVWDKLSNKGISDAKYMANLYYEQLAPLGGKTLNKYGELN